jgi:hypothetical protein
MNIKDIIVAHYKVFGATVFIFGTLFGLSTNIVWAQQFAEHTVEMTKSVNVLDAKFRKQEVEKQIETYNRLYEALNEQQDRRKLDSLNRELVLIEVQINS